MLESQIFRGSNCILKKIGFTNHFKDLSYSVWTLTKTNVIQIVFNLMGWHVNQDGVLMSTNKNRKKWNNYILNLFYYCWAFPVNHMIQIRAVTIVEIQARASKREIIPISMYIYFTKNVTRVSIHMIYPLHRLKPNTVAAHLRAVFAILNSASNSMRLLKGDAITA